LKEISASDCRLFPDIYLSQDNVAMSLRSGGLFNDYFITGLPKSPMVKEYR